MNRHQWLHATCGRPLAQLLLIVGLSLLILAACQPGGESADGAADTATDSGDTASADTTAADPVEVAAAKSEDQAPPPRPLPTGPDVQGIDVSHHSGEVDWQQVVDAGYDFVYVKATEGVDALDPKFAEHWKALADLGVYRGAYHFYVTEDDPEEQARFFLDTVDWRPGDLRPVVDVELIGHGTEPGLADRLRRFLEIVEGELGVAPVVYTMPNFWDAHLGSGFEDYPLWVAEYGVSQPRLPERWDGWHLWQHAQDREVTGVEKGADLSRLHPEADFRSLLIPPAGQDEDPRPATTEETP